MKNTEIHIANMVCPRCISAVERISENLNLPVKTVELGSISLKRDLTSNELTQFSEKLDAIGFDIVREKNSRITSEIKSQIINQIHHSDQDLPSSWSKFLSQKLHRDYSTLSKIFSQKTGKTVEQFVINQKIEFAKELLSHSEMTLKEIAHLLDYSSSSHLSRQFKKVSGITASEYKNSSNSYSKKALTEL